MPGGVCPGGQMRMSLWATRLRIKNICVRFNRFPVRVANSGLRRPNAHHICGCCTPRSGFYPQEKGKTRENAAARSRHSDGSKCRIVTGSLFGVAALFWRTVQRQERGDIPHGPRTAHEKSPLHVLCQCPLKPLSSQRKNNRSAIAPSIASLTARRGLPLP